MQCITHPRTPQQSYNSAGSAPIGASYSVESDCVSFEAVVVAPVVYSTLRKYIETTSVSLGVDLEAAGHPASTISTPH